MGQLTERLVEYALALSYEDLPPEVVERTKRLILDTVGCALGAAPWQAPSVARTPATVIVGGQQTSPDMAAFANGVMTRYLDYNDYCYTHGSGHPSDTIAPVLAAGGGAPGGGQNGEPGRAQGPCPPLGPSGAGAPRARPGVGRRG